MGQKQQTNLFNRGKEAWEQTKDFQTKINAVTQEVRNKYQVLLSAERNWFKRQIIRIQMLIELKKKKGEISSAKNLHLVSSWR
jgi:hypothetical protein